MLSTVWIRLVKRKSVNEKRIEPEQLKIKRWPQSHCLSMEEVPIYKRLYYRREINAWIEKRGEKNVEEKWHLEVKRFGVKRVNLRDRSKRLNRSPIHWSSTLFIFDVSVKSCCCCCVFFLLRLIFFLLFNFKYDIHSHTSIEIKASKDIKVYQISIVNHVNWWVTGYLKFDVMQLIYIIFSLKFLYQHIEFRVEVRIFLLL